MLIQKMNSKLITSCSFWVFRMRVFAITASQFRYNHQFNEILLFTCSKNWLLTCICPKNTLKWCVCFFMAWWNESKTKLKWLQCVCVCVYVKRARKCNVRIEVKKRGQCKLHTRKHEQISISLYCSSRLFFLKKYSMYWTTSTANA